MDIINNTQTIFGAGLDHLYIWVCIFFFRIVLFAVIATILMYLSELICMYGEVDPDFLSPKQILQTVVTQSPYRTLQQQLERLGGVLTHNYLLRFSPNRARYEAMKERMLVVYPIDDLSAKITQKAKTAKFDFAKAQASTDTDLRIIPFDDREALLSYQTTWLRLIDDTFTWGLLQARNVKITLDAVDEEDYEECFGSYYSGWKTIFVNTDELDNWFPDPKQSFTEFIETIVYEMLHAMQDEYSCDCEDCELKFHVGELDENRHGYHGVYFSTQLEAIKKNLEGALDITFPDEPLQVPVPLAWTS